MTLFFGRNDMCLKNTNLPCAYQIDLDSFFFCVGLTVVFGIVEEHFWKVEMIQTFLYFLCLIELLRSSKVVHNLIYAQFLGL